MINLHVARSGSGRARGAEPDTVALSHRLISPRATKGGMACLPRWLARTLGWARRGRTADLATWTSAAFDSMSVLFAADRLHVSVRCLVMQQNSGAALQQQHELDPVQQLQLAVRRLRRPCRAP